MSCFWTALQGVTQVCAGGAGDGAGREFWVAGVLPAYPIAYDNNKGDVYDAPSGFAVNLVRVFGGGLGISADGEIALAGTALPCLSDTLPDILYGYTGSWESAADHTAAYNLANAETRQIPQLLHTPGTNQWSINFRDVGAGRNAVGGRYCLSSIGGPDLGAQLHIFYSSGEGALWKYERLVPV